MDKLLAIFAVLAIAVKRSACVCPHEDTSLTSFASLYPSLKKSDKVEITVPVLLDVPSVDVTMITISGTGKLVFGRNINITVKTRGIFIKDQASFIIGSNICRHEDYVNIVLEGERSADQSTVGDTGEKFIALEGDGEIQIHGKDRLSWTKLTATVDRVAAYAGGRKVKYLHLLSEYADYMTGREGPAVYVFNNDLTPKSYDTFDFYNPSNLDIEQSEVDRLVNYLISAPSGNIVALSTINFFKPSPSTDLSQLFDTLEEMAGIKSGELLLRELEPYDAFSLVFVKGGSDFAQDADKMISKLTTSALASIDFSGYKVSAASYINPESKGYCWVDFRILNPVIGYPLITVKDDISSWSVGDEILLTSTDYDPSHGEVRKIKEIVSSTSFRLSDELLYRHFGKIENKVDMRAEVALLTRNIKIEGAMSRGCPPTNGNCDRIAMDTFGGHIKIMHTFGGAYLQGAEFTHMGQATNKGTYPIHFHMLKNITGKIAVVQGNSIHHTFQRCITVHGTFGTSVDQPGVVLKYNVAYNVFGHCYFLEDGAEPATILIGNIGAYVRKIDNGFFTTDKTGPTTFWITNPKAVMISNVAAGSEGFGIWYTFPKEPVGPSAGLVYAIGEAARTPLWTFDNNVAHSNLIGGFNLENILLDEDGNVAHHLQYTPLSDPLNSNSDPVKVQITRLTVYKNKFRNVWARGGLEFMQLSSAESQFGAFLARGKHTQQQFMKKSVIVGQSSQNAEEEGYPDAVTPASLRYMFGICFIYGPQYISDTWFTGFKPAVDRSYLSGALTFKPSTPYTPSVLTSVYSLRFGFYDATEGNRMFVGNTPDFDLGFGNDDGNELSSVRDLDGSLSDCGPPSASRQIVKPEKFLLTDNCTCVQNWQMCTCRDLYGAASLGVNEVFSGKISSLPKEIQVKRLSYSDPAETAYENHYGLRAPPRVHVVLGDNSHYYQMQFAEQFPKGFSVFVEGVESGYDVVIGFCFPGGTTKDDLTLTIKTGYSTISAGNIEWADTLQKVRDDDTMGTVFLDGRILYMHFAATATRNYLYDTAKCFAGKCPTFFVKVATERPYVPCFSPTPEELGTDNMLSEHQSQSCVLAKSNPKWNWGVGDTTASHDGRWGIWSLWSECSVGSKQRVRFCDNPSKFGDGLDCVGDSVQTQTC